LLTKVTLSIPINQPDIIPALSESDRIKTTAKFGEGQINKPIICISVRGKTIYTPRITDCNSLLTTGRNVGICECIGMTTNNIGCIRLCVSSQLYRLTILKGINYLGESDTTKITCTSCTVLGRRASCNEPKGTVGMIAITNQIITSSTFSPFPPLSIGSLN
jgi:hypothetical protein